MSTTKEVFSPPRNAGDYLCAANENFKTCSPDYFSPADVGGEGSGYARLIVYHTDQLILDC